MNVFQPTSPLVPLVVFVLALVAAGGLVRFFGPPPAQGRFITIDGLRGYLALSVFLHHACIWYFYLRTGRWDTPPSALYTNLGQSGVAVFFMITGFLFTSKILNAKARPGGIDFPHLYVSRVLRLTPLYLAWFLASMLIVASLSGWVFQQPPAQVLKQALFWLFFTIPGNPDVNGVASTFTVNAGVAWSLVYEWFFYLMLPVLALLYRRRVPLPFIGLSVASLVFLHFWHPIPIILLSFAGGFAASFLVRFEAFCRFCRRRIVSFAILLLCGYVLTGFATTYNMVSMLLLAVVFCLIAGGNSVFGVLESAFSRMLGEISYSIYLLHGLLLFVLFHYAIGFAPARAMSASAHWLTVCAMVPILVLFSFATYSLIEKPGIRMTGRATRWLQASRAEKTQL